MTIEIALLISVISVAFAVYTGITNNRRNIKSDSQKDAIEMTTVTVRLEGMSNEIVEMKTYSKELSSEMKDMVRQQIIMDQSLNAAWKKIDSLTGGGNIND